MNDNKVEDVTDLVRADGTFGRVRPTFEFMKPRLSRWIAFGLGSGLSNVVPGTMGTLFAWVAFAILAPLLGDTGMGVLIALDEPVRVLISYSAITAVFWGLTQLPLWWPSGVAVFCGVVAYWLLRFAISLSLGAWFVTTTRVSTLLAALNQLRAPRFLTIPLAVLFRFVPVALDEARGVMEAMRLRGYSGSYLWRHPLDGIEKLVVPVLAASARSADDLSAAALIRGLGSGGRPTVVDRLRFGAADAVLLALSAGLVVLALQPVWGR